MIARLNDVFSHKKILQPVLPMKSELLLQEWLFSWKILLNLKNILRNLSSLQQIQRDVYQLSDLTNSLLLLTKFDKENIQSIYEEVRIDEVIFEAFEGVEKSYPELKLDFLITEETSENAF
jgi:K+-sensing histidine kinase KdpD